MENICKRYFNQSHSEYVGVFGHFSGVPFWSVDFEHDKEKYRLN